MIWTLAFWKGAAERGIKTFAASAASLLVGNGIGLLDVDFVQVASVSGLATLVSLLIAIGNAEFTAGTPSAIIEYVTPATVGEHVRANGIGE